MGRNVTIGILAVRTVFTIFAFKADMTFVAILTINGNRILAIFAILAIDSDMTILTVFSANVDRISQFQIIRLQTIGISDMELEVFAGIDIFTAIIFTSSGSRTAFHCDFGMLSC